MKIKFLTLTILTMFFTIEISAQSSFGLTGLWNFSQKGKTLLNNFESNPSNFSLLKDWGLSISYGSEFSGSVNSNLYLISLSKSIGNNNFTLRYTPGYQKEFIFSNASSIVLDSSNTKSLTSEYTYKELFGLGYSYKFNKIFSAGFTVRFFTQEFNQEGITYVLKDSTFEVNQNNTIQKVNSWKADIGINYFPIDNLALSISSVNLFYTNENSDKEFENFLLKKNKKAQLSISYLPVSALGLNIFYETDNSFYAGFDNNFNLFNGNLGTSFSVFHDQMQSPFIAGIIPAVSFSNKLFGITLSGVKYFSNRNNISSFNDFSEKGIKNIINNRFSFDKAVLTLTFTLNTLTERKVEFIGVDVVKDIYTTLPNYTNQFFALGKAVNLTNKLIIVKPFCKIEGINENKIESPSVKINPNDTAEVKFYAFIPDNYDKKKNEIFYADFYLSSNESVNSNDDIDDQTQKAVLINGKNAWDGKVSNLIYFIEENMNYSIAYAKKILSEHKTELDTIPYALSNFYKAKIIYNKIVKNLVYVSDPRASADYVQYPEETLNLKGGDCDDLSVLYSSLLESIGIQTALVDYKPGSKGTGHVNLMINTQLSPEQAKLITNNDSKYFIRKNQKGEDQIWITIETTSLTNFETAWKLGTEKFNKDALDNLGLAKNKVQIVDVE